MSTLNQVNNCLPLQLIKCVQCGLIYNKQSNIFVSPNCYGDHCYCINCTITIINSSLSLLNVVPKCIISYCKKSFNLTLSKEINQKLFSKYQTNPKYSSQYIKDKNLITGYIRQINQAQQYIYIVPKELIELIHDFYKLVCFSLLDCNACNGRGTWYQSNKCDVCNGKGRIENCQFCIKGIISYTLNCAKCNAIGTQVVTTNCICSSSGVLSFFTNTHHNIACKTCNGEGIRMCSDGRGECSDCDGLGFISKCIYNCDDGSITTVYTCEHCDGKGKLFIKMRCKLCNGDGKYPNGGKCLNCNLTGSYKPLLKRCWECNFTGKIFYTDFNKIISKQQYCHKCNVYSPRNMMIYWSDCYHTYCIRCVVSDIKKKINCDEIPVCLVKNCKAELSEKDMKMNFLDTCEIRSQYLDRLRVLISRKNKFECAFCPSFWHSDEQKLLLCGCGHEYTRQCGIRTMKADIFRKYTPLCYKCGVEIDLDDVALILGKRYVETVKYNKYNKKIWRIHTKITGSDVGKVLRIRPINLSYNDNKLNDKIINFLNISRVKVEDIKYLNVIRTKSANYSPLFQLYLNNENIAHNIFIELINLKENNKTYEQWDIGFWEIHKYKQQRYNNYNCNIRFSNNNTYNHQTTQRYNTRNW